MHLRTIFVVGIVLTCLCGLVMGQERERRKQTAETRMEQLQERLSLTEEQQKEVQPILDEVWANSQELREKARQQEPSAETMRTMREEMGALQTATREKLAKILTEEQLTEYDQMIREEREKMRNRRSRRMR